MFSEGRKLRNHFLKHKAKTDSAAVENSVPHACSKTTTRFPPTEIVLSRFCTTQTKCGGMGFLKGKTVYVQAQIDAVSAGFPCKLTSLCSALRPEWLAGWLAGWLHGWPAGWLARSSGGGGVRISEQNLPYPTVGFTVAACRSFLKHKAKSDSAPPMIQPVAGVVQNHHAASPPRESFKPTPNAL